MVTSKDTIEPGEVYGLELVYLNALRTPLFKMLFLQRLAIGGVSETVEQSPYNHTFLHFVCKYLEQEVSDGVVSEVEILQMN